MNNLKLALLASDSKKEDMLSLITAYKSELVHVEIMATGETGRFIQEKAGQLITLVTDSVYGGDTEIGALVVKGEVSALILLYKPFNAHTIEPDKMSLLKVCSIHNVLFATNMVTAKAVLNFILNKQTAADMHNAAAEYLEEMADKQ